MTYDRGSSCTRVIDSSESTISRLATCTTKAVTGVLGRSLATLFECVSIEEEVVVASRGATHNLLLSTAATRSWSASSTLTKYGILAKEPCRRAGRRHTTLESNKWKFS